MTATGKQAGAPHWWDDVDAFMQHFGAVIEHAPWLSLHVFEGLEGKRVDGEELASRFCQALQQVKPTVQLQILNAHPQLACGLASAGLLTADSQREQAGAGLDRCSEAEFQAFEQLNKRYLETFGFPFIIAVRGLHRSDILQQFQQRINHNAEQERLTALQQVCAIARFRIEAVLDD